MTAMAIVPGFLNKDGFSCYPDHTETTLWPFSKTIWRYAINEEKPLIFVHPDGKHLIRIYENRGFTDFGSIPTGFSILPGLSPYRFSRTYLFHDNHYVSHMAEISTDGGASWKVVPITRRQADDLMRTMIEFEVDPGNVVLRNAIWSQVRAWGWIPWSRKERRGALRRGFARQSLKGYSPLTDKGSAPLA